MLLKFNAVETIWEEDGRKRERKEKKRNHIIVPKSLKITSQNSENDGDDDSPEEVGNITTHASEGGQQHLQAPTPKGV